jgi:hypothetical protein
MSDSALVEDTDAATMGWLVRALEHAHSRGQTKLVGYLEVVVEDLVFEVEAAARPYPLLLYAPLPEKWFPGPCVAGSNPARPALRG